MSLGEKLFRRCPVTERERLVKGCPLRERVFKGIAVMSFRERLLKLQVVR